MTLRLADRWIWDSWPVDDLGGAHHLFYLQAPKSLGDPRLRHRSASVGHAVSPDYVRWRVLPDALGPAPAPAWDDLAIWTGSVVRGDDRWHLFYSALSRHDDGRVQRIGRASSDDLIHWRRSSPPIVADPRWYEDATWRDPWVFRDDGGWHMLITARAGGGGVLGHARSPDLEHWEVGPPLTTPAGFFHLEVPQVALLDGRTVLLFCCLAGDLSSARRSRTPRTGMWSAPAASPLGPFDLAAAAPLADPALYAAHLVPAGLIGFTGEDPFEGVIPPPRPVFLSGAGTLSLVE